MLRICNIQKKKKLENCLNIFEGKILNKSELKTHSHTDGQGSEKGSLTSFGCKG